MEALANEQSMILGIGGKAERLIAELHVNDYATT